MRFNLKKRMINLQVPPYKRRLMSSLITLGIFCFAVVIIFYIVDFRIRPTLINLSTVKAKQMAVQSINQAIRSDIAPNIQYQNLIKIIFTTDGKIAMIQPDTGEINRISAEAVLAVQKKMEKLAVENIRIPMGQILGSKIMAGFGPNLRVKVFPLGFVESSIIDKFESAGINQVRHRIFVTIKTTVKMVVPLVSEEIKVNTDIPLTEAVIVGDVPSVFMGNGGIIIPAPRERR